MSLLQEGGIQFPQDSRSLQETMEINLESLGFDSLALVLFIVAVEKKYSIKIDPLLVTAENFSSISKIINILNQAGAR